MLVKRSMRLYDIHSSSRVSATPSRFSSFLIWFFPSDRISKLSRPASEPIFSMLFVERLRCLHALSVARLASIFSMGGSCAYSRTWRAARGTGVGCQATARNEA